LLVAEAVVAQVGLVLEVVLAVICISMHKILILV
jgi:hypothetical protein